MNPRKFIAANSREALKLVRAELGADAMILSNRKVQGGVEIVAIPQTDLEQISTTRMSSTGIKTDKMPALSERAVQQATLLGARMLDEHLQPVSSKPEAVIPAQPVRQAEPALPVVAKKQKASATAPAKSFSVEQQALLAEIKSMRNLLQEQLSRLSWSEMQRQNPQRGTLLRDMINVGFSPSLSRQLLEKMPANGDLEWVKRIVGHNLRISTVEEDVVARGGVYALVGPTGVGKTTTTAKLAARAVVRYGANKVALVTTDSYRIGAHEQLKIYGKILGVSVHAVRDTNDLKLTLSSLKNKHLVLIDTMGLGQRDNRVTEQMQMFDEAGVQRLLLLNATSSGSTLDDVVRMYGGSGVVGCIPTKLDEAVTLGTVLDVIVRHKLTMHYIANGQRVPEDLHEVNMEYLLHRTFQDIAKKAANTAFSLEMAEMPIYMAGMGGTQVVKGGQYAN